WIQQEIAVGLKKIAMVHLALAGFKEDEIRNFDIRMTASSAIDELYRIETWQSRANVIESLRATEMFPKKWILKRFTDMTDDEIDDMDDDMKEAQAEMPMMGMDAGMAPPPGPGAEALPPGEPMPMDGMPPDMGMDMGMGAPPMPEGYDEDQEQEVLLEYKRSQESIEPPKEKEYFETPSLYETNYSKSLNETVGIRSGWDNLLIHNELDGLYNLIKDDQGKKVENVLIQSIIADDVRDAAKQRTKILLTEGEEQEEDDSSDEITPNDLPTRRVLTN
ncbi:MAG: portal protein, partial [Candidatus Ranarchaeia archaeon]